MLDGSELGSGGGMCGSNQNSQGIRGEGGKKEERAGGDLYCLVASDGPSSW